ncbi:MAG: hypothetical protein Q9171_000231 [Xanthocarpia ochracea]
MDEEGNIFIFGRYKDIIIRGGENLSPGLIENCLGQAGVFGQVISVPDDVAGEVPLAVVQVADQDLIPKIEIHKLVIESLGPSCLPTAYMTLVELGIPSFPLTASGKALKTELRQIVLKKLAAKDAEGKLAAVNGLRIGTSSTVKTFLCNALGSLTGLPTETIPQDQPLSTMLDSINILRLQAYIQQTTSKNIPINRLLRDTTISALAKKLNMIPLANSPSVLTQRRRGPPTTRDMVHTRVNQDVRCVHVHK